MRRGALAVAVALLILLVAGWSVLRIDGSPASSPAVERFFAEYVDDDGRVVRRDQGGDTVSEGQAYALQLALEAGDAERFKTVWSWTADHLQRDDALFAWQWQEGKVTDSNPAPDADVDIATALLGAAERFGRDGYAKEARRIAGAVMDRSTTQVAGELVLVAGPWAVADRIVNPGYLAPCDYHALADATGDERWRRLNDDTLELLAATFADGLPPDWMRLAPDGARDPIAAPTDPTGDARYGLDAVRVVPRLSTCPEGRALIARMWPTLRDLAHDGAALAYTLDGRPVDEHLHPVGLVAAAVAAHTASHDEETAHLLREAHRLHDDHPTYYGAAWLALGEQLLHDAGHDRSRLGMIWPAAFVIGELGSPAPPPTDEPTPSTADPASGTPTTTAPNATTPIAAATTTTIPSTTLTTEPTVASQAPTTTAPTAAGNTATTIVGAPPTTSESPQPDAGDDDEDAAANGPTTSAPARDGSPDDGSRSGSHSEIIAGPDRLEDLLADASTHRGVAATRDRAHRSAAALTIAGFAIASALGAALGIRERVIIRKRSANGVTRGLA